MVMNGPTTANRPAGGAPVRMDGPLPVWDLVTVVALFIAVVPFSRLLEGPSFVDQIAFENPTKYHIRIEVSDGEAGGWMAIGAAAERNTTSTFRQIVDQGEVWLFRFSAQGEDGGELRLTREQLERDQWQVRIPDRVDEELQAAGAPFPPY
jgi:hypothetical protein